MVFLIVSCGSVEPVDPKPVMMDRFEPWQEDFGEYQLQPGDELDVKLTYNPEFSDRVVVGPDGRIHLTLVGVLKAEGRTSTQLAQEIAKLYATELRRPDVSVVPRAFFSQVIYVGGQVQRPGLLTMNGSRISVLHAVTQAGGLLPTGRLDQVIVIRRTNRNTPMLRVINLKKVLEGEDMEMDIPLNRFDVVYVPRSSIAEINLWIDQHINQVIPFQRSFGYTISDNYTKPGPGL